MTILGKCSLCGGEVRETVSSTGALETTCLSCGAVPLQQQPVREIKMMPRDAQRGDCEPCGRD